MPYPPARLEDHYLPDLDRILERGRPDLHLLSGETSVRKEFKLPDVGEGLTEADIVSWHVKPGDAVTINQIIVDIETAKAVVELPSPYAGTVTALLADEGQTVDVGTPIIAVEVPGADDTAAAQETANGGAGGSAGHAAGGTARAPAGPRRLRRQAGVDQPPAAKEAADPARLLPGHAVSPAGGGPAGGPGLPARRPASPRHPRAAAGAARAPGRHGRARWRSRPCGAWPGTSASTSGGWRAAGRKAGSPGRTWSALPTQTGRARRGGRGGPGGRGTAARIMREIPPREERIPVRGVRKHTAAAMVASAFTAPHVTEFLQVDVTETMAAARRARELPEFAGIKVSPLLFVAKALLIAAGRHPMINSSWDDAAQEIVVKRPVNLGIAVAAERGLIVPNVKGADTLPLAGLARAIDELAATARAGKATPADLAGGTITITNVGVFGVDTGTPILMPGEAAILAFGRCATCPGWWRASWRCAR